MLDQIFSFNKILESFKIKAVCTDFSRIENYFYYDLKLNPTAKVKDITKYSDEISLALQTPCKPTVKIIHNKGIVRLEFVSNRDKSLKLFPYLNDKVFPKGNINCLLGQSIDGHPIWMDISQNPHMIIAGTTGSGKSVLIHNIIANLVNHNNVDLFLVDPKQIEFFEYKKNKYSVFNYFSETIDLLHTMLDLMEFRYKVMTDGYPLDNIKPVIIIIDEFADLIMQDREDIFYTLLCKLAQKCRAAKIHIILSTQRPSVNIINGSIKANFPARIACKVASFIDSKVILDSKGAENLLGNGDALLRDNSRFLERFQVAYTDAKEICDYFGAVDVSE